MRPSRRQVTPMAELSLQDRLQPALLDRLTDDEPDKKTESRDQRVVSLAKLRNCILRDLSWLLNAVHLASTEDLSDYPNVARSVLNYGLPSFAGGSAALIGAGNTEDAIRDAVKLFEPRLLANTVKVTLLEDKLRGESHNTVALEIEAELWAQPIPLRMFMKTELDLELGAVHLTEESEATRAKRSEPRRR
jgi:type VI secretion system protein ImpF